LQDILDYLDETIAFTIQGRAVFMRDRKTQLAVIRVYEVIGEIVKRLPDELRAKNTQVDWRRLMGFRDFLAHNYDQIVLSFVWTAVEDIPNLRKLIEAVQLTLPTEDTPDYDTNRPL
jgi:uncharacterized protein with HEPN domain